MNLIQLVIVNIKRLLKNPEKIGFMLIMPIAVIFFVNFLEGDSSSTHGNIDIAYNIEDEGLLYEDVLDIAVEEGRTYFNEKDKALQLLETNEVAVVYNIPSNFSEKINNYEKPTIESYKREEGNATVPLEMKVNNNINELIKEKILMDNNVISNSDDLYILETETILTKNEETISNDMHLTTMMLIYFIILDSSIIVAELTEYKKKNIMARAITTPNRDSVILGSIVLSLLVFQVVANSVIVLLGSMVFGYNIINFPIIFINFILASAFAITLSVAVTRVVNNEGVGSIITTLISMSTLFLSMFAQSGIYQDIPQFIANLGKFTPQYWIFDSLEKAILFPNILIVALIVLTLFTAGSFRLKDYIRR